MQNMKMGRARHAALRWLLVWCVWCAGVAGVWADDSSTVPEKVFVERSGAFVFEARLAPRDVAVQRHGAFWKISIQLPKVDALEVVEIIPGDYAQLPGMEGLLRVADVETGFRRVRLELLSDAPYVLPADAVLRVTRWADLANRLSWELLDADAASRKAYTHALREVLRTLQFILAEGVGPLDSMDAPCAQVLRRLSANIRIYVYDGQVRNIKVPADVKERFRFVTGEQWPSYSAVHLVNAGAIPVRISQLGFADTMLRVQHIVWDGGIYADGMQLEPHQKRVALLPSGRTLVMEFAGVAGDTGEEGAPQVVQFNPGGQGEMTLVLFRMPEAADTPLAAGGRVLKNTTPFDLSLLASPGNELHTTAEIAAGRSLTLFMVMPADAVPLIRAFMDSTRYPLLHDKMDVIFEEVAGVTSMRCRPLPPVAPAEVGPPVVEEPAAAEEAPSAPDAPVVQDDDAEAADAVPVAPPPISARKGGATLWLRNVGTIPLTVQTAWGDDEVEDGATHVIRPGKRIKLRGNEAVLTLRYAPSEPRPVFYRQETQTVDMNQIPQNGKLDIQAAINESAVQPLQNILSQDPYDLKLDTSTFDFWTALAWGKRTEAYLAAWAKNMGDERTTYRRNLRNAALAFENLRRVVWLLRADEESDVLDVPPGVLDPAWAADFVAFAKGQARHRPFEKWYADLHKRIQAESRMATGIDFSPTLKDFLNVPSIRR